MNRFGEVVLSGGRRFPRTPPPPPPPKNSEPERHTRLGVHEDRIEADGRQPVQERVEDAEVVLDVEAQLVLAEIEGANLAHQRHASANAEACPAIHAPPVVRLAGHGAKRQPWIETGRRREAGELYAQWNGPGYCELREIRLSPKRRGPPGRETGFWRSPRRA